MARVRQRPWFISGAFIGALLLPWSASAEPTTAVGAKPAAPTPQALVARPSPLRMAGFVTGGIGLATIGVGAGFGIAALVKRDASQEHCIQIKAAPLGCDRTGVAMRRDAGTFATISTVTFGLGAAALAGGVVLLVMAPPARPSDQSAGRRITLGTAIGPGTIGGSLTAQW